jgi:hypothetical protein
MERVTVLAYRRARTDPAALPEGFWIRRKRMRRYIFAAAAVAALASAGSLVSNRAEAMSLPGAGHLAGTATSTEQVYLRCTRAWNGWRWVRSCVDVVPGYGYGGGYGPGYGYGGGYGYYGGWRPRPRYYGYY